MPSASFSHSATIAGSPGVIWDRMQDPEVWVGVGPIERVHDAELADDGTLRAYRWDAAIAGRRWQGTARTSAAVPGELMEIVLDSSEIRAKVTAHLTPNRDGTHLEVRIDAASKGMLAGLFWGLVEQSIRAALPDQTAAFGRRIAAG